MTGGPYRMKKQHYKAALPFKHIMQIGTVLTCMALCVNCRQNEIMPEQLQNRTISLTGLLPQMPETKTALDENGLTTLWAENDVIGVFSQNTFNAPFTLHEGSGTVTGLFTGTLTGTPLYAYYPYSDQAGHDASAISGQINAIQTQDGNQPDIAQYDVKAGTYTGGDATQGFHFAFRQLATLLAFSIDATGTVLVGENVQSLSITAAERALTGSFTLDLTQPDSYLTMADNANESLTLSFSPAQTLTTETPIQAWGFVNGAIMEGDVLTFSLETEHYLVTFQKTAIKDFQPGFCYQLPLVLTQMDHLAIQENSPFYSIQDCGYYDLSGTTITPYFTYTRFSDQWGHSVNLSNQSYRIQNNLYARVWECTLPNHLKQGDSSEMSVATAGSFQQAANGTFTVRVGYQKDNLIWLVDDVNKAGYILHYTLTE